MDISKAEGLGFVIPPAIKLYDFCDKLGIPCVLDEMMKNHTTFKIGGMCDIFITPQTLLQLQNIIKKCRELGLPYKIIGNGSNLLVSDFGVEGAVICLSRTFGDFEYLNDGRLFIPAGMPLNVACIYTRDQSLAGLEFAYGIPGSIGGAVCMNAGAYGGEISAIVETVQFVDKNGDMHTALGEECDFGYRHSRFLNSGDCITGAVFLLSPGNEEEISNLMGEFRHKRASNQPLDMPSAGSAFKRPQGGKLAAAGLIDGCGLKGLRVGGAMISTKHSGFVVNAGEATSSDVIRLTDIVRELVKARTGIELEREIVLIGSETEIIRAIIDMGEDENKSVES